MYITQLVEWNKFSLRSVEHELKRIFISRFSSSSFNVIKMILSRGKFTARWIFDINFEQRKKVHLPFPRKHQTLYRITRRENWMFTSVEHVKFNWIFCSSNIHSYSILDGDGGKWTHPKHTGSCKKIMWRQFLDFFYFVRCKFVCWNRLKSFKMFRKLGNFLAGLKLIRKWSKQWIDLKTIKQTLFSIIRSYYFLYNDLEILQLFVG